MKKLIIIMTVFFAIGLLSYAETSKVIRINDDDYDNAVAIEMPDKKSMGSLFNGKIIIENAAKELYRSFKNTDFNKITFIYFDKKDNKVIKNVLDYYRKKKYAGTIEIIGIIEKKNSSIEKITRDKGWKYDIFYVVSSIDGTVTYDGKTRNRSEVIQELFDKIYK